MRRTLLFAAGLCLLVLLAFGRSLTQDFAPLDDDLLITHNLAVRGVTSENLKAVFTTFDPELYIPLTFVSYQLNWLIGGLHPWVYHATNLLLHAGNALLTAWLLLLLTKRRNLSLVGGLLFAVHPLNTEAVVWLAGRKDLLSTLFFLLSVITYLRYRAGRPLAYAGSLAFFLLALLSKVMAVTLPVVLLLTDLLIERRRWNARMLIDKVPYAILSGIFLAISMLGKERILAQHSIMETALMAGKSTAFYLQKFLLPIDLGVFHPYHGEISLLLPAFFVPLLILIALAALAVFAARRKTMSASIAFGPLFFLVTLAPTFINFHKGGEMYFASDRYPYLPQVGLLFLLIMGGAWVMDALRVATPRKAIAAVAIPVIALLTALSFSQTRIWDSAQALFGHTLELYPQSVAARSALAAMAKDAGRYEQAIRLLREGLAYGEDVQLRMGLGTVYAKIGRVEDAADQFRRAQSLDPQNPEPLVALGVLDEYNGKTDDAIAKYRQAVAMDASYVSARNKLGSLLFEEGKIDEAEEQFRAALAWNPNTEGVLFNLSLVLEKRGLLREAIDALEKAHALSPDDPRITTRLRQLRAIAS